MKKVLVISIGVLMSITYAADRPADGPADRLYWQRWFGDGLEDAPAPEGQGATPAQREEPRTAAEVGQHLYGGSSYLRDFFGEDPVTNDADEERKKNGQ